MGFEADEVSLNRKWHEMMSTSQNVTLPTHPDVPDTNLFGLNPANTFGIEVEVENVFPSMSEEKLASYCASLESLSVDGWWRTDEDGSLRNSGREFISYPLKGNEVGYGFQRLFSVLHPKADFNLRAGIHVHVNCRDMRLGQISKAILLAVVFESMMFRMTDPSRHNNIFCVPVTASDGIWDMLNWFATNKGPAVQKYSALNVVPLTERSFGTVEFRHLETTNDMQKLQRWLQVIDSIWTYARNPITFTDLLSRVSALTTSSMIFNFGEDVFADVWSSVKSYADRHEINHTIAKVKQIVYTDSNVFCGDDMASWLSSHAKFQQHNISCLFQHLSKTSLDTPVENPED